MIINDCEMISFTQLSLDKKKMILTWRNNENIRKWMHNTEIISKTSHLQFIKRLEKDIRNQFFLVQKNNANIGVIYFNDIDDIKQEVYFGLYKNPYIKLKGIGSILLELCIKYTFEILKIKKLQLEVLNHNKRAINLYKRYGFLEVNSTNISNKKIIYMELENENR